MATPDERTIPAWWVVLPLLIVGLGAGLLFGMLPGPPSRTPAAEVASTAPAAPGAPAGAAPVAGAGEASAPRPFEPLESAPSRPSEPDATRPAEPGREPASQPVVMSDWTSLDRALDESRRTGKPVFIDFSADWCGPCQRLKREVFETRDRWQAVRGAVIPVSIVDRRRETGSNPPEVEELYRRFGVDAFPTLVVFSPQSGRATRTQGFGGGDATVAWIEESARAVR